MALNNVINRNFAGFNIFTISLVEDTEPKDFHSKFFMFIKAVPSVKTDSSVTGRSYDNNRSITFKVEAEKAISLSFALEQYSLGKGKNYEDTFGGFEIFADMSRSQYSTGNNNKKAMKLNMFSNPKSGKSSITMSFSSGDNKVPIFMTPYEAFSISRVLRIIAEKCIELEFDFANKGIFVKSNRSEQSKPQFQQKRPIQTTPENPFVEDETTNKSITTVTDSFSKVFGDLDPFNS